jgi:hypothetical protein
VQIGRRAIQPPGAVSLGEKRLGYEADNPSQSSDMAKYAWRYTSTPPSFFTPLPVMQGITFSCEYIFRSLVSNSEYQIIRTDLLVSEKFLEKSMSVI